MQNEKRADQRAFYRRVPNAVKGAAPLPALAPASGASTFELAPLLTLPISLPSHLPVYIPVEILLFKLS